MASTGGQSRTATAFAALLEAHYPVLKRIAARAIRDRSVAESMSPTSLVAETVLRILRQRERPRSEDHLRGLATVFMTRALADAARARMAQRRGGGRKPDSLDKLGVRVVLAGGDPAAPRTNSSPTLLDTAELLDALELLARDLPRQIEVVTMHCVAEIPLPKVAKLMEVSERTAYRDLQDGLNALAAHLRK